MAVSCKTFCVISFFPKEKIGAIVSPGEKGRGSLIEPEAISIVGKNWRRGKKKKNQPAEYPRFAQH